MRIIVTGGAGFIGSAVIRYLINETDHTVLNLDSLTYAGNLRSLTSVDRDPRYHFAQTDICDKAAVQKALTDFKPEAVMHLAAESHVDRSIDGPEAFIQTNVVGTYNLLHQTRLYWTILPDAQKRAFRFHHISTDEVFGALGSTGFFTEETAYAPNSPYSASKASSDHLVRAWHHTYGLPTITTNCSNNYGPYHFPEKLIPLVTINALNGKPLPVYGKGDNVRDWLYVDDHARALVLAMTKGKPGETYNIGGHNEKTNLSVVETICDLVDEMSPWTDGRRRRSLITFVTDRPGHDQRYAIDAAKMERELAWKPRETFETGLRKTVAWYLENRPWWQAVMDGSYRLERLGLGLQPVGKDS